MTTWRRLLTTLLLLVMTTGCGTFVGKVSVDRSHPIAPVVAGVPNEEAHSECAGVAFWFGDTNVGECAEGGTVSVPGANMVIGIVETALAVVFGRR